MALKDADKIHQIRRFYADVAVRPDAEGFAVALDGRLLKTPARNTLRVRSEALAGLIAEEWAGQGEIIRPETMPLTRLCNVAIDRTPKARADMIEMIAGYAGTDLVSYRAENPAPLVRRQAAAWDPLIAWAEVALGARLPVVVGVAPAAEDQRNTNAIANAAAALDDFALTGAAHATGLAGSCVIAFALAQGELSAETAFAAAALDDLWQIETWGEDAEARARLLQTQAEIAAISRYFHSLRRE